MYVCIYIYILDTDLVPFILCFRSKFFILVSQNDGHESSPSLAYPVCVALNLIQTVEPHSDVGKATEGKANHGKAIDSVLIEPQWVNPLTFDT